MVPSLTQRQARHGGGVAQGHPLRSPAVRVDPGIFKAYDVRGIHGEQIDADVAYAIGRAFARVLSDLGGKPTAELRVDLGRDMLWLRRA